jgi:hypothetical protein
MYEEIVNEETGGITVKYTDATDKVWSIPADPSNRMYQEYLAWKELQ